MSNKQPFKTPTKLINFERPKAIMEQVGFATALQAVRSIARCPQCLEFQIDDSGRILAVTATNYEVAAIKIYSGVPFGAIHRVIVELAHFKKVAKEFAKAVGIEATIQRGEGTELTIAIRDTAAKFGPTMGLLAWEAKNYPRSGMLHDCLELLKTDQNLENTIDVDVSSLLRLVKEIKQEQKKIVEGAHGEKTVIGLDYDEDSGDVEVRGYHTLAEGQGNYTLSAPFARHIAFGTATGQPSIEVVADFLEAVCKAIKSYWPHDAQMYRVDRPSAPGQKENVVLAGGWCDASSIQYIIGMYN